MTRPHRLPDDAAGADAAGADPAGADPAGEDAAQVAVGGDRQGVPGWRPVAGWVLSVLAFLLVMFALVAPEQVNLFTPGAFVRLPVEGLVFVVLVLVLPVRARPVVASLAGVVLGLLTIVKLFDLGFYASLNRPFHPVLDEVFLANGMEFLRTSFGRLGAIGVEIGVVAVAVALLVLMTLSVRRLTRLVAAHRTPAARAVTLLGLVWVTCAALGAQLIPGQPLASSSAATLTYDNARQVHADLHDKQAFARQAGIDPFANTPGDQLLTGLRGKDVLLAFVESYGRSAIEDPQLSPQVDAALAAGTRELQAAGFAAKSGFLTSPTSGGGSFLAHSTLLSGLWINNQQRYNTLVDSHRLTLTRAFTRANWRSVAVVPDTTRAWPEGAFYGYDKIYAAHDFGYHGPSFGWAVLPDQYALATFQKTERANPAHAPVMAEMALVSSHAPWAPLPRLINWNDLGDGSVFYGIKKGQTPVGTVWRDPNLIRAQYAQSIAYTLRTLTSYLQKYGDKNTVMIYLGDHQPAPVVTRNSTNRDVPITIVARDPAVLDRIAGWGWTDGLKPAPNAPVWPMDSFRNRFLTAFGPQP